MKKFISLITFSAVVFSALSCREVEELSVAPEEVQTPLIKAKVQMDTVEVKKESSSSSDSSTSNLEESDPPKDKIKW